MKNCLKKDTRWTKDDLFGTHYCQQQKTHWRHEMRTRSHHVWTNSCCCLDTAANWTQIRRDTSGVQQNQMIIQFCCCLVNLTVFSPPTSKSNHKSILLHPWSVSSVLWRIWWTFNFSTSKIVELLIAGPLGISLIRLLFSLKDLPGNTGNTVTVWPNFTGHTAQDYIP